MYNYWLFLIKKEFVELLEEEAQILYLQFMYNMSSEKSLGVIASQLHKLCCDENFEGISDEYTVKIIDDDVKVIECDDIIFIDEDDAFAIEREASIKDMAKKYHRN
jgi:hypothetical protein